MEVIDILRALTDSKPQCCEHYTTHECYACGYERTKKIMETMKKNV